VSKDEALLRELLREIQSQRKKEGLVIEDRIVLVLNNKEMEKYEDEIKEKVGATRIKYDDIRPEDVKGKIEFEEEVIKFNFMVEK
jgi:acetolactate synthase small subunit